MFQITDRIRLEDHEVEERFVRAMGPAGRNPRREQTAVELRFDIGSSSLPREVKERLRSVAGRAVTAGGVLVLTSRVHRSQVENRKSAHARFIKLLQRAATTPRTRWSTTPSTVAREERLASKKRRGVVKASREWKREA